MVNNSFNLVSAAATWKRRWKIIAALVLIILVAATITVYCVPHYYRSKATVVPANPMLADKARLFNTNIQSLYSYFGSGDDLDRLSGIADMDTSYQQLVNQFALIDYYQLANDSLPLLKRKAVLKLRKDITVRRNEKDQLEIIAWTKDRQLSANLVNGMVAILNERQSEIWDGNYARSLSTLSASVTAMEKEYTGLSDSLTASKPPLNALITTRMQTLLDEIKAYQRARDEFKLAIDAHPPVLYAMENGIPAAKAERPDKAAVLLAALLIGIVFSSLLVLIVYRENID